MGRRGQSVTLSISDRDKALLEALALEYGMTWGERPNISKLVEAIARKDLKIAPNHDWSLERIEALNQARMSLVDSGKIADAITITQLLRSRSELTIPLRNELEQFVIGHVHPWRIDIEHYINRQQPFQLSYQDARDIIWHFTIRHARIVPRDERQYLDCWCEETEGSQDVPELIHNRTLRLDRITDAAISAIKGPWHNDLDTLNVEMHLYEGLAFAYRSKKSRDISVEWLPDKPQARQVIRQITSTFWFVREVLPYGGDCEVIGPESVREKIATQIQTLFDRYQG